MLKLKRENLYTYTTTFVRLLLFTYGAGGLLAIVAVNDTLEFVTFEVTKLVQNMSLTG